MSKAAIMSFMPFLASLLPERITKMEKGRYYRDRFVAISEVSTFYLAPLSLKAHLHECGSACGCGVDSPAFLCGKIEKSLLWRASPLRNPQRAALV